MLVIEAKAEAAKEAERARKRRVELAAKRAVEAEQAAKREAFTPGGTDGLQSACFFLCAARALLAHLGEMLAKFEAGPTTRARGRDPTPGAKASPARGAAAAADEGSSEGADGLAVATPPNLSTGRERPRV